MPRRPLLQLGPAGAVRRPVVLACSLVLAGGAACSGDPSAEDERRQLRDDLVAETDGALGEEEATCVADALHDAFGDDSFEQVLRADADGDDAAGADGADSVRVEVIDIFSECDALEGIIEPGG